MDSAVYAHYETGDYSPPEVILDDKEYGKALDTIVKGCVDVVLTDDGLGKAGETPAEAAVRNVKREAGLSLAPQRFKFLCVTSLLWQHREEPSEHGSADISLTFTAALSADECEAIRLDRAEYEEACWIDPSKVIPDTSYHTAVRRALQHIAIRKQEDELHAAVEAGLPDQEIGKLARIAHRARKAVTDIERRPHQAVRAYSSSEEREVLVKASQAAQSAISINATAAGISSWVYKSLGY